jgi:hypothetical protein
MCRWGDIVIPLWQGAGLCPMRLREMELEQLLEQATEIINKAAEALLPLAKVAAYFRNSPNAYVWADSSPNGHKITAKDAFRACEVYCMDLRPDKVIDAIFSEDKELEDKELDECDGVDEEGDK